MKRSRLIPTAFMLSFGLVITLSLFGRHHLNSEKISLQNAVDLAVLSAARESDKSREELDVIAKNTLNEVMPRGTDYQFISMDVEPNMYGATISSKYVSYLPRIFGFLPQEISTSASAQKSRGYDANDLVIVAIENIEASRVETTFQDIPNSVFAQGPDRFDLIGNSTKDLTVIVTDDVSDPALCQKIQATNVDTDLIYIGEKSQTVETFFAKCIQTHPVHACIGQLHISPNPEEAVLLLKSILANYGKMRIAC